MEIWDRVKAVALAKDWQGMREVIESVHDHHDMDNALSNILCVNFTEGYDEKEKIVAKNEIPMELIDLALERFSQFDSKRNHDSWTHSLSHFTNGLWKRGLMQWVKRFNEQAFGNAEKGWGFEHAYGCCDRLVVDIVGHGTFATNPRELGITDERVDKVTNEYNKRQTSMVKAMPFASQKDADIWTARWKLADMTNPKSWDDRTPDMEELLPSIAFLKENGIEVDEVDIKSKLRALIDAKLLKMRANLRHEDKWVRGRAQQTIEKLQGDIKMLA